MKEQGDRILWLRKLVQGGTDRSYGIQVARMAGIPPEVIDRAREILKSLERSGSGASRDLGALADTAPAPRRQKVQLTLFEAEPHPVLEALREIDITSLTPIEALLKLDELKRKADGA